MGEEEKGINGVQKDLIVACFNQYWQHARHVEIERFSLVAAYLAAFAALVYALYGQVSLQGVDKQVFRYILIGFEIAFSALVFLIFIKFEFVFRSHVESARSILNKSEIGLADYQYHIPKSWFRRLPVSTFFPIAILLFLTFWVGALIYEIKSSWAIGIAIGSASCWVIMSIAYHILWRSALNKCFPLQMGVMAELGESNISETYKPQIQRKGFIDYSKWISAAMAVSAVILSLIAICNSKEALKFQKEEAALRRQTNVKLSSSWSWGKVYFGGYRDARLAVIDPKSNMDTYESRFLGLDFYAKIKIFNASEHDISVDGAYGIIIYKGMQNSLLGSADCFEEDSETRFKFPVLIRPNEQRRIHIRMPIPSDSSIVKIFGGLTPNRNYSADEMVKQYNARSGEIWEGAAAPWLLQGIFGEKIMPPNSSGTWDQYYVQVNIHLASGESIIKRLNILTLEEL